MSDITKCLNKNCKIKEYCYRYTSKADDYQSYANFNEDKIIEDKKDCESFLIDRKVEGER